MKNIAYQAPEMEIVDLKLQSILCSSPGFDEGTGDITDPNNPERE